MMPRIALIDYGMGNLHSVEKALQSCGADVNRVTTADQIMPCDAIVLPGVGHFADGMRELSRRGLAAALTQTYENGLPMLGICLGMQMLLEQSDEAPGTPGLGFVPGRVRRFTPESNNYKVPHMGWNTLHFPRACPLFTDMDAPTFVYFVHSYYVELATQEWCAATTTYDITFAAALHHTTLFGTQFHPEKSQSNGLTILRNFVTFVATHATTHTMPH